MSCCVRFCQNRSGPFNVHGLRFYRFVGDQKRKVLWLKAARRFDLLSKGPTVNHRICSTHFVTGKFSNNPTHPDYVPSIFPFNKDQDNVRVTNRVQRFIRRGKRAEAKGVSSVPLFSSSHPSGRLHGQQLGKVLPQEPSQAVRTYYELRLKDAFRRNAIMRDVFMTEEHNYCKRPHPAPVQPEQTFGLDWGKEPEPETEGDSDQEPQEPRKLQETGEREKETGQNEGNASSRETQTAEAQTSDDSPNKGTKALKPLLCPVCGDFFWSLVFFASHVQKHVDERFQCKVCDKKFRYKHLLERHMDMHNGDKKYNCKYCDKSYTFKRTLQAHEHLHLAGFDCTYCDMQFRNEDALERHLFRHEERERRAQERAQSAAAAGGLPEEAVPRSIEPELPKVVVVCQVCGESFKRQDKLDDHMTRHTGERPHPCPVCSKRFALKARLKYHMRVHTEEGRHSCSFCQRKFRRNSNLQLHLQNKHTGKTFECSDCGRKFASNSLLRSHAKVHSYSCSVCMQVFETLGPAQEHLEIHKQEKESRGSSSQSVEPSVISVKRSQAQFSCTKCGKIFSQKKSFDNHVRNVHTEERPFLCSVCGLTFKVKSALTLHMKAHTGEKPFSCSICCFPFKTKHSLTLHMKAHTGEKPFSCSVCGFKYKTKRSLTLHRMVHTGEKPFGCSLCQERFRRKEDLKPHMLKHSGTKPFACRVCDERFASQTELKRHKATHSTETFSCTKCPNTYSSSRILSNHMVQAHREHSCSVCRQSFMTSTGLEIHNALKHAPQNPEDERREPPKTSDKATGHAETQRGYLLFTPLW